VRVRWTPAIGLAYDVLPAKAGDPEVTVAADDMLHVPGPGFNGLRSVSQLQYGLRNAAGIAEAADRQAAGFIGDGVRPDFAIEVPGKVNTDQASTLQRTFKERNSGHDTSRVPIVMSGGMKLHQLTMSSVDAELLATRSFQIEEICRVFGVPPFMIGHTEKTTSWGSGIEQMSIGFVKYTLQRHLVAFEQELNFKLFKTSRNFCEFVTAGLERGDIKGRFEAYRIALGRAGEPGWIKPSEIRRLENMPQDNSFDQQQSAPAPAAAP
jgi:HK97 family phage portal protein